MQISDGQLLRPLGRLYPLEGGERSPSPVPPEDDLSPPETNSESSVRDSVRLVKKAYVSRQGRVIKVPKHILE